MQSNLDLQSLASQLGYADTGRFVSSEQPATNGARRYLFRRAQERLGVDAVHFEGDRPVVYFAARDRFDAQEVTKLHRKVWNDSTAPILILTTRNEVRIYDAYAEPSSSDEVDDPSRLVEKLKLALHGHLGPLAPFRREAVDSGRVWKVHGNRFNRKSRCDETLLRNLEVTRDRLRRAALPIPIIDALLPRLILVLYLEHSGALGPPYFGQFATGVENLTDLLETPDALYAMFGSLAEHFNGDLLPVVDGELQSVRPDHLNLLRRLLRGEEEIATGQLALWPLYDFSVIPIELVSSIYELFVTRTSAKGVHYTPPALVELLLNEVLPWPGDERDAGPVAPTVLDPACGSGIFLVEAFRRISERARHVKGARLTASELRGLLTDSIFGVDEQPAAIRIAAFSLYLAMLDQLEPRSIWAQVRFPCLTTSQDGAPPNLQASDAFTADYADRHFDLVVGNPPWGRNRMQPTARKYCEAKSRPVADEMAQAFIWLAADMASDGRVAVLCPSKWLFNREGPDREFRRAFFAANEVHTILNLSDLRRQPLFRNAVGPASAIVFAPTSSTPRSPAILYCAPHGRGRSSPGDRLRIESPEMKWLPREIAEQDETVWKTFTWGGWRDYALLARLGTGETLRSLLKRRATAGWFVGVGFQPYDAIRNRAFTNVHEADHIAAMPHLQASALTRYHVAVRNLLPHFTSNQFRRLGKQDAVGAPHVLVKEGLENGLCAAFSDAPCSFRDVVTGIAAPNAARVELKAMTAYLNSSLAAYFVFFRASSWGVERSRIKPNEWLELPAAPLENPGTSRRLAELLDEYSHTRDPAGRIELRKRMDAEVYDAVALIDSERILVDDFVRSVLPALPDSKAPAAPLSDAALERYLETYVRVVAPLVGESQLRVTAAGWIGEDLAAVRFLICNEAKVPSGTTARRSSTTLEDMLKRLDALLLSRESENVSVHRHLRIFDGDSIYIVKPTDALYWSAREALTDADETLAELLSFHP